MNGVGTNAARNEISKLPQDVTLQRAPLLSPIANNGAVNLSYGYVGLYGPTLGLNF